MNKNIKILHVYKVFFFQEGGIPAIIRQLVNVCKAGFKNEVLAPVVMKYFQQESDLKCATVHKTLSLGSLFSMPISPLFPFAFLKLSKRFDIVDFHAPFPLVDLSIFFWFPKKTKLVIHWHADIKKQKKMLFIISPLIKKALHRADKIIVSNPILIEQSKFLRRFKDKCDVIPYGIPEYWFKDPNMEQLKHVCSEHPHFILAVGRLVKYKGFDVLIESMQKIHVPLIIIGDGVELDSLQSLAKKYNVMDRVIFKGGVSNDVLKAHYHACKLFVMPSVSEAEAFGLVQLEAMACKKPVVNTYLKSAVPWVARNGYEAVTVNKGAPDELSDAINGLLDDNELIKNMGSAAYKRVVEDFSALCFIEKTYQVYQNLLK